MLSPTWSICWCSPSRRIRLALAAVSVWFCSCSWSSTQCFFEWRKCRNATSVLSLIASRRRIGALRRAGGLIRDDTLAQKRASTVFRQAFGAYDSRKKGLVSQILLDGSQRFLAGEKHGAHARGGIVRGENARFLKLHFENCMSLVKLRRPREVTQREKQASQNTDRDDPNALDERMPEAPKIDSL